MLPRRLALLASVLLAGLTLTAPAAQAAAPAVEIQQARRLGPLTELVIQRLLVGDLVAASKFGTGRPIDDPVREQQVLDAVRAQAGPLGLDPARTVRFFQDQISANKEVQRGLFAHWTRHPDQAPATRPDLAVIREKLDRLTTSLLAELVATNEIRRPDPRCRVLRLEAGITGAVAHRLDRLHRRALHTGTGSLC